MRNFGAEVAKVANCCGGGLVRMYPAGKGMTWFSGINSSCVKNKVHHTTSFAFITEVQMRKLTRKTRGKEMEIAIHSSSRDSSSVSAESSNEAPTEALHPETDQKSQRVHITSFHRHRPVHHQHKVATSISSVPRLISANSDSATQHGHRAVSQEQSTISSVFKLMVIVIAIRVMRSTVRTYVVPTISENAEQSI